MISPVFQWIDSLSMAHQSINTRPSILGTIDLVCVFWLLLPYTIKEMSVVLKHMLGYATAIFSGERWYPTKHCRTEVNKMFRLQERCIHILANITNMESCRPHFKYKLHTLASICAFEICKLVRKNKHIYISKRYTYTRLFLEIEIYQIYHSRNYT